MLKSSELASALSAMEMDGNVYCRYSNPNTIEFVDKMCKLEGAEAGVATSSGMAAVFSSLAALLNQGDHILASRSLFGSTHQVLSQILSKWGITFTYADLDDTGSWESLVQKHTRLDR